MAKKAEKPQHAPSAKLALDDVLKSLQDLIRNDLTDEGSNTNADLAVSAPAAIETHPPSTKEVIQELEAGLAELTLSPADPAVSAATATHTSEDNTQQPDEALVLPTSELELPASEPKMTGSPASTSEFLQDPAPAEVDIAPLANLAPVPSPVANSEFLQDEPPMDSEIASLDNVTLDFGDHTHSTEIEWDQRLSDTPKSTSPAPSLARTVELELPVLVPPIKKIIKTDTPKTDAPKVAGDKKIPPAPTPPGRPKARGGILTQGLQAELPLTTPSAPSPAPIQAGPSAFVPDDALPRPSLGSWDDIPVLQDAIEVPETPAPAPVANASQGQAHRMAIQIAARLNVELRRAGKSPLSTDIVTRLVHLLQETLALGTSKVDNRPQRKD